MNDQVFTPLDVLLPPLSDELMYQIIFCMEDQANSYLFDLADGVPVQRELVKERGEAFDVRYRELPDWKPADGFRIMEKFVSSLKNPIFREKLKSALAAGKGVFRNFKNQLKEEPAVERLWYYFKERELKRAIYIWYEQLTEISFFEALGEPEEEVEELILSDFTVTYDRNRWGQYMDGIREQRLEAEYSGSAYPLNEMLLDECKAHWGSGDDSWSMVFVEAPGALENDNDKETIAGCIGAEPLETESGGLIYVVRVLYVEPRYRGLGIFKLLLDRLTEQTADLGADRLVVELGGKSAVTVHSLEQRGFLPFSERLSLNLVKWREARESET